MRGKFPDDTLIRKIIENKLPMKNLGISIGLVIIDEVQDMTELYCDFVKYMMYKLSPPEERINLVLIGDPFQCIFAFKGANLRYLLDPESSFEYKFSLFSLSKTYRFGKNISDWINQYMNPLHIERHYPKFWTK